MKNLFGTLMTAAAIGIGYLGGSWLWRTVLEDKAENLVDRLKSKKKES